MAKLQKLSIQRLVQPLTSWLLDLGDTRGKPSWALLFPDSLCDDRLFFNSPGRFFAINEIKALVAHIILEYDIKLENGKGLPHQTRIGSLYFPRNADLLFRKRQG
jgi:hypothetical protein